MKIRFQPASTMLEVEIRDLRGHRHATWRAGEEQEIGADEKASFQEADGTTVVRPVIDALFSAGPFFVDAATGKNPHFTCDACGEDALDDSFTNTSTMAPVYLRVDPTDKTSPKLCMTDFLAQHPQFESHHARAGASPSLIAEARSRRKDAEPAAPPTTAAPEPAPAYEPPKPAVAASPTSHAETDEGHV